jgi:hypothetical protein
MNVKRILPFLVLLLVSAASLLAQPTARGNFVIGSRFGFSTSSSNVEVTGAGQNFSGEGGRATQFSVSPAIGYFFFNNFAFGVGMDYFSARSEDAEDPTDPGAERDETIDSDLLFGPFARIYLPFQEDKALFVGLSSGFGHSEDRFDAGGTGGNQTIRNNIVTVGLGAGITIFSDNGLALETLVKYNWGRSQNTLTVNGQERETRSTTNAVDLSVGIQYYFSR